MLSDLAQAAVGPRDVASSRSRANMQSMIVGTCRATASQLRSALARAGHDVPREAVVPFQAARSMLGRGAMTPDLVFVTCAPDLQEGIAALQQLRNISPGKLIAVGAGTSTEQVLSLLRLGAYDYVDCERNLDEQFAGLSRRLREEIASRSRRGLLTAVASASGGCGCSVIATNVAAQIAVQHGRCGLVDLNFHGGDLATLLNVRRKHTIADLCLERQHLDETIFEKSLFRHPSGIHLLASGAMFEPSNVVEMETIAEIVAQSASCLPHVVLDLGDISRPEQALVAEICDTLLLVVRLDFVSLLRTHRSLRWLEAQGLPAAKIRLVANHYGRPGDIPVAKASEALQMPLEVLVPHDAKVIGHSLERGNPAILDAPSSKVAKALVSLADRLLPL